MDPDFHFETGSSDEESEVEEGASQSPWEFAAYSESVAEEHARRIITSINAKVNCELTDRFVPLPGNEDEAEKEEEEEESGEEADDAAAYDSMKQLCASSWSDCQSWKRRIDVKRRPYSVVASSIDDAGYKIFSLRRVRGRVSLVVRLLEKRRRRRSVRAVCWRRMKEEIVGCARADAATPWVLVHRTTVM